MPPEIGAANIRVGSTIQGLLDGMKQAAASVRSTVYSINNQLTDSYKRAAKEQAVFRGGLSKLSGDLTDIGKKMAIVGGLPALFAAGKAFKDYAELQKLQRGLERYGESLKNVREIAKLPNIGVFDGAKALIGMKAMKLSSDLATRSLKAFANAITDAGGSAVDLEPALVNLNQFVRGRHINQVDLRQLATRMPQTNDAMEAAFGTQDVEKLNEKMKSIGVTAFIDKFVTELEKIPFAGGGAANTMEQFADATTFASAALGEGADKAFDITGKISGLTTVLDNLTTNFQALTPEAQKSIFAIGALAVGMPVLIGTVGGLIKLLPLLATGFGAISAPITATIAVVGVAAAAIITNWDSVKKFLTDSTWWTTLTGVAQSALGILTESFKVVLNLIQGDWSNLWKALVNIGKNGANLLIDGIGAALKGALGLFGTFNEALGFKAIGQGVSSAVKYIDGLTQKFRFDVPDSFAIAGKAIDGVKGAMSKLGGGAAALAPAAGEAAEYFEKMSESAFKIWQIDLAGKWAEEREALKQKIKSYKELIGVTASLTAERLKLSKPDTMRIGNTVEEGRSQAKAYGAALIDSRMAETQAAISKSAAKYFGAGNLQLDAAVDLNSMFGSVFDLDLAKEYFRGFAKAADESLTQYADRLRMILGVTAQFKDAFGSAFNLKDAKKFFNELPKASSQSGEKYAESITRMATSTIQLNQAFKDAFRSAAQDAAVASGELIGNLMTGAGGVEDFGKRVLGTLSSLMKDMGKALIASGTAGIALKLFAKVPAAAIAAGIALVALGQATSNKVNNQVGKAIPKFAKGAAVYGPTAAIVGDNPNARHNPELIAPASKVDKYIEKSIKTHGGGGGGVQVYIPRLEIENDKFYVAFKRSEVKYKALLGG